MRRMEEVEDAIRPGGLAPTKSVRIKQILEALDGDDLTWLPDVPLDEAATRLVELPGVGRKTAACVLMFAFGMPDVPVDTHVSRVGTRLGLFRPGASFEEMHDDALRFVAARGRARVPRRADPPRAPDLRHARRPRCEECPLLSLCPYGREFLRDGHQT